MWYGKMDKSRRTRGTGPYAIRCLFELPRKTLSDDAFHFHLRATRAFIANVVEGAHESQQTLGAHIFPKGQAKREIQTPVLRSRFSSTGDYIGTREAWREREGGDMQGQPTDKFPVGPKSVVVQHIRRSPNSPENYNMTTR
jgi:hypothetical protein